MILINSHYKYIGFSGLLFLYNNTVIAKSINDKENDRPNVIYIFPDQMRNHALGIWSQDEFSSYVNFKGDPVFTPNLDSMARDGVILTHAMSNCPVSSPHRGSLLSGMFPGETGVPINCQSTRPYSSLRDDITCIGDVFSKAGYNCAYIGKYHVDHPTPNDPENPGHYVENKNVVWDTYTPPEKRHGFDFWYSYGTFNAHKSPHYWDTNGKRHDIKEWSPMHESDIAISYLRNDRNQRENEKPFFMMISFNPPHTPFNSLRDCMEEDYLHYKDKTVDELLVRSNVNKNMPKAAKAPFYFASVTGVDRAVGKILNELKRSGLDKNTIVVFSSDHGELLCAHNTNESKNMPYSESMNVPFILKFPGVVKPRVDNELLLSTPDIMPTLLGLCGLESEIPSTVQGRNYAGRFMGNNEYDRLRKGALYIRNVDGIKDKYGISSGYFPEARGVKTLTHTFVLSINKSDKTLKQMLLIDDVNDPDQMHPLPVEENKELVSQLLSLMSELLREANDSWYKEKILSNIIPY